MSQFFSIRPVKSPRKAKRCYWCFEVCPVGEPRLAISGYWEDFFSDHWHLECNKAREEWQALYPKAYGDFPDFGEMQRGKPKYKDED